MKDMTRTAENGVSTAPGRTVPDLVMPDPTVSAPMVPDPTVSDSLRLDPMAIALDEAKTAFGRGDVPVGAVITRGGEVITRAHNTREAEHTAIGHAEINAIAEACRVLENKWLADCTLYVTLEPCPMCAGAILQARIPRVVCGAADPVAGAMGSVWALHKQPTEQKICVEFGDREAESRALLRDFFQAARQSGGQGFDSSAQQDAE